MKSIFLWPDPKPPRAIDFFSRVKEIDVENKIEQIWPNSYPVLFSSARSGLSAVLRCMEVQRGDHFWLPNYTSHCLYETVARFAAPTSIYGASVKAALIYHQWGFTSSSSFEKKIQIVEDSADTLFLPGKLEFHIEDSRFMIQSLPKVLGSVSGGVVYCRNSLDQNCLRQLRELTLFKNLNAILRILSARSKSAYLYWHGVESLSGRLPSFLLSQIIYELDRIETRTKRYCQNLLDISPELYDCFLSLGRLPSNIPLDPNDEIKRHWGHNSLFSAGIRNFNSNRLAPKEKWKKVLPFPIHTRLSDRDLSLKIKRSIILY